jgi:hypothetical protein
MGGSLGLLQKRLGKKFKLTRSPGFWFRYAGCISDRFTKGCAATKQLSESHNHGNLKFLLGPSFGPENNAAVPEEIYESFTCSEPEIAVRGEPTAFGKFELFEQLSLLFTCSDSSQRRPGSVSDDLKNVLPLLDLFQNHSRTGNLGRLLGLSLGPRQESLCLFSENSALELDEFALGETLSASTRTWRAY